MDLFVIISGIVIFLVTTLVLVGLLLYAKAKLTPQGQVKIDINGERGLEVATGGSLLSTLGDNKVFLPSACGGGGGKTERNHRRRHRV